MAFLKQMRQNILDDMEQEIESNNIFGEMMEIVMNGFIRRNRQTLLRNSGYVSLRDYPHSQIRQNYFNIQTSQIFNQIQNNNFQFRFYSTGGLSEAAFQRYNALFVFGSFVPGIDIPTESLEPLKFDIRCCICSRCNVLQKRSRVKINRETLPNTWLCLAPCLPIQFDAIPNEISILNEREKRSLRLVKLYGRFRGPTYRDYQRYLGVAHLSTNWNCWRDISGFIGINNNYNRFEFVNNARVVNALQYLTNHNPLYNFTLDANQLEALVHLNDNREHFSRNDGTVFTTTRNVDQQLIGTEDGLPNILPFGEEVNVNENIRNGLTSIFAMTFENKEGRVFPYLYPNGFFLDDRNEYRRAFRIRSYLFHWDSRFRYNSDWMFYQLDRTESIRIHFNDVRILRHERMPTSVGNVVHFSQQNGRRVFSDATTRKLPVTIRSSNTYFKKIRSDLLCYMASFGIPHLFLTFNCDEPSWAQLHSYIHQFGNVNTIFEIPWYLQNPVLSNHYCYERINAMIQDIINEGYAGYKISHHFRRYEFQQRGTLHCHLLLWLENPTDSSIQVNYNTLLSTIHGHLPDIEEDPFLFYLVKNFQTHTHGNYCWPEGATSCRFSFPKAVIPQSFFDPVTNHTYLKRSEADIMINSYNPEILKKWRGNMDIKLVTSEIVAKYITKYCTKEEPFDIMVDDSDEVRRYLETRNYSTHEIAHLLSTQPITAFDTKIVRIPCCSTMIESRVLLPLRQIRELDPEQTDIFYPNATDSYINRFPEANGLTILQYFSMYEKAPIRSAEFVDSLGKGWKRLTKRRVVRVYPFYRPGNGDLYFAQIVLCNSIYRSATDLLNSIPDLRQYCVHHFREITSLNDRIQQLADGDIQINNDIEINATTEIRAMYNLHTPDNDYQNIEELSPDQYRAYQAILQSREKLIIVQGGPGTGKSTLIKTVNHFGTQIGKNILLTATTGLAGFLINGRTLHSRLMLYRQRQTNSWLTNIFQHDNIQRLLNIDIIIVDEYSMMDDELLNKVMEILDDPVLRHIKLVLCGDLNQLPPVSGQSIVYSRYYQEFYICTLSTNHRTQSNYLQNVIDDFYNDDELFRTTMIAQFINSRITFDAITDTPYIYPTHALCDNHNNNRLGMLRNRIYDFTFNSDANDSRSYFNSEVSSEIKSSFRYSSSLRIAIDARVMLLVNLDQDAGLVNGSIGIVKDISLDPRPEIQVEFITGNTTRTLTLRPDIETHDNIRLKQFPICLAYALTIHKVQGMTLDSLVVGGIDRFWNPQLLYVAISRVRNETSVQFLPSLVDDTPYYTYEFIRDLFSRTSTRNATN